MGTHLKTKHLLSMMDLTTEETLSLLARASELKRGSHSTGMTGKTLAILFEKPSLRTRVGLEIAMFQMGGYATTLSQAEVGLGVRETIEDVSRVLSRWIDGIACRTTFHSDLEELATKSSVPVINALTDVEHPTQGLADLLTIQEVHGDIANVCITFIGDGDNVAASLALGATAIGAEVRISSPEGYDLPKEIVDRAKALATSSGGSLDLVRDPEKAVLQAHVVYTDVWTSMGLEDEAEMRRKVFSRYQVNPALMRLAHPKAVFMHNMPVHYGEEVPEGFLNNHYSVAYDQAENRLHTLKAVLEALIGN